MYKEIKMFIAGEWCDGAGGRSQPVINPATSEQIGTVPVAETSDLERAATAAWTAFQTWKVTSVFDRYKILRRVAELMRERAGDIAIQMTLEQGKPVGESKGEILAAADAVDWFAEEGRRAYGWLIPARVNGVTQVAIKEPVGPVAGFSPWNFPINQAIRKIAAALASGNSIIVKCPEETPSSCVQMVKLIQEAGVPDGVVQLVYGVPSEISEYLIAHPAIRKITFTGSTAVGKHLASLAGKHMKRATMELGGHAPAIIFDDADFEKAFGLMAGVKFRNGGQICASPSRFLVQEGVYEQFVDRFTDYAKSLKVGDGFEDGVGMGPLANPRRVTAMEEMVADAVNKGATLRTGGKRIGNKGNFFEPTVLTEVTTDMKLMNEEPFGPIAPIMPFRTRDEALTEANRLDYGLAAYLFTGSAENVEALSDGIESGMITVNHYGLALPEVPFGGMKDSGYGSEGGAEALDGYFNTKFVTRMV